MSELLPLPPRKTSGFGDPALVFPEFSAKQCMLEKVIEGDREGEDSSYGKGSFDSRFSSSPSISRNNDDIENPKKLSSLKLSSFKEEEEIHLSPNSGFYVDDEEEKRDWSGCFRKCCAWTCMFLSIILIIVLLTGLSVNSSIKSRVPQVVVTNLKFSRLNFTKDLLMTANLDTVLQFTNKNDNTVLYYSKMKAVVSSENINLGQKKLPGFNQIPGNVTSLKIETRRRKTKVYDVDATLLRDKEKKVEVVVNVMLSGKLKFDWMGFRINLPIVIACEDVKQSDVMNRLKPECDVRIFSQ